jgi:hypothetical protein
MLASMMMSQHLTWDLALWVPFFIGQLFFVLKRAGSAIRSSTNPIKSRRAFIYANWDILSIRLFIELIFPYYPVRHLNFGTIASTFHVSLPSWIPPESRMPALGFLALGYFADSILDWISQNQKVPAWIRQLIGEQIPNISGNGKIPVPEPQ